MKTLLYRWPAVARSRTLSWSGSKVDASCCLRGQMKKGRSEKGRSRVFGCSNIAAPPHSPFQGIGSHLVKGFGSFWIPYLKHQCSLFYIGGIEKAHDIRIEQNTWFDLVEANNKTHLLFDMTKDAEGGSRRKFTIEGGGKENIQICSALCAHLRARRLWAAHCVFSPGLERRSLSWMSLDPCLSFLALFWWVQLTRQQ